MKIAGPERYKLSFDTKTFVVTCSRGTPRFSSLAITKLPKLYIVSIEAKPIYVGVTRQSMSSRFRMGFNATGESGYHGYGGWHTFGFYAGRTTLEAAAPFAVFERCAFRQSVVRGLSFLISPPVPRTKVGDRLNSGTERKFGYRRDVPGS
jgi:hypothetical protein